MEELEELSGTLDFMVIHADYSPNSPKTDEIILYGVTAQGNSVCAIVPDFNPYFFCGAPSSATQMMADEAKKLYNQAFKSNAVYKGSILKHHIRPPFVVNMTPHQRTNILGFNQEESMYKVEVRKVSFVVPLRGAIEDGSVQDRKHTGNIVMGECRTYESDYPYVSRFLQDKDIVGCCWISLPKKAYYRIRNPRSTCRIEVGVKSHRGIVVHSPEESPRWSLIAPLTIFCYDIETLSLLPDAPGAHVIQIGVVVYTYGDEGTVQRFLWSLGPVDTTDRRLAEVETVIFGDGPAASLEERLEDEKKMFLDFHSFLVERVDPDVITVCVLLSSLSCPDTGRRVWSPSCSCTCCSRAQRCLARSRARCRPGPRR